MASGEWLVLVRNRYLAQPVIEHCRREGYLYRCFTNSPQDWESFKAAVAVLSFAFLVFYFVFLGRPCNSTATES